MKKGLLRSIGIFLALSGVTFVHSAVKRPLHGAHPARRPVHKPIPHHKKPITHVRPHGVHPASHAAAPAPVIRDEAHMPGRPVVTPTYIPQRPLVTTEPIVKPIKISKPAPPVLLPPQESETGLEEIEEPPQPVISPKLMMDKPAVTPASVEPAAEQEEPVIAAETALPSRPEEFEQPEVIEEPVISPKLMTGKPVTVEAAHTPPPPQRQERVVTPPAPSFAEATKGRPTKEPEAPEEEEFAEQPTRAPQEEEEHPITKPAQPPLPLPSTDEFGFEEEEPLLRQGFEGQAVTAQPAGKPAPATAATKAALDEFDFSDASNVSTQEKKSPAKELDDFDFGFSDDDTTPTVSGKEAEETEFGIPIDIPVLGTVVLIPVVNPTTKKVEYKAQLADRKITIGELTLDNFTVSMLNKNLGITGRATLLGKQATFGLKEAEFGDKRSLKKAVLGFTFKNTPTLEIMSGKSVVLRDVTLTLEKKQPMIIEAETDLFGQVLTIGLVPTKTSLEGFIKVPETALSTVIPPVADTPLSNGIIKNAKLTIRNIWSKTKEPLQATMTSTIDLPQQATLPAGVPLKAAAADVTADDFSFDEPSSPPTPTSTPTPAATTAPPAVKPEDALRDLQFTSTFARKGVTAKIDARKFPIPYVGVINEAHITIDTTDPKTKKIDLTGDLSFSISHLGTLQVQVQSTMGKDGIKFSGTIPSDISYAGFSLKGFTAGFDPVTHKTNLTGTINLYGLDLATTLSIIRDPENKGSRSFAFSARSQVKEFKPFASTGIPGLESFMLKDFDAELTAQKVDGKIETALKLHGDLYFLGVKLPANLEFVRQGLEKGVYVNVPLTHDKTLSDIIPPLKNPIFDGLLLKEGSFFMSSIDFKDPETGTEIKKGLSFRARVPLSGTLEPVGKLLGNTDQEFTLYGKISPATPRLSEFGILISEGHPDRSKTFSMGNMSVVISGAPSFGLAASVYFRNGDDMYEFVGQFSFKPTEAELQASLTGTIHNIFGLSGWEVIDPAILLGMIYGSPGIPTEIGGNGQFKIKDHLDMGVAFVVDPGTGNIAFEGHANKSLTWMDALAIVMQAAKINIPDLHIPEFLKIYDLYAKFAMEDAKIGNHVITQGLAAKGKMDVLGKTAELDIRADMRGIKVYGGLDPIDLAGIFKVSGRGDKHKPEVDIELTLERQKFLITGRLDLAGAFSSETYVEINNTGFHFMFEDSLGGGKFMWGNKPLLYASVTGNSAGSFTSPNFILDIMFQQHLKDWLKDQIVVGVDKAKEEVEKGINSAKDQIDKINDVIKDADEKIKDAERKVEDAKDALKAVTEAKESAERAFRDAQDKVDSIRKEITDLDDWYNNLPDF